MSHSSSEAGREGANPTTDRLVSDIYPTRSERIVQHVAEVVQGCVGDVPEEQHQHIDPDSGLSKEVGAVGEVPDRPGDALPGGHDQDIDVHQQSTQSGVRKRFVTIE